MIAWSSNAASAAESYPQPRGGLFERIPKDSCKTIVSRGLKAQRPLQDRRQTEAAGQAMRKTESQGEVVGNSMGQGGLGVGERKSSQ
jgi:hypothetical protein